MFSSKNAGWAGINKRRACAQVFGFAIILSFLSRTAAQIPEGWEIVEIAPSGTEFYYGQPDINDRGQVVFHRRRWPSQTDYEIMHYERGRLLQLTIEDAVRDIFPRINNHGDIVWSRDVDGDGLLSVVRWRDNQLRVISESGHAGVDSGVDINDYGHIVWSRSPAGPPDTTQLFLFDGQGVRQITYDSFANYGARLNRHTELVFTRYDFSVSPWASEVVGYFDGQVLTLADGVRQLAARGLNDNRAVVWQSPFSGVELWENGSVTTLLRENAGAGGINNRGNVSIVRTDRETGYPTVWLYRHGELIQLTDPSLRAGAGIINGRGEIALITGTFPSLGVAVLTKRSFAADLDFDGDVDLVDFGILQGCFGSEVDSGDCTCWSSDANHDGATNETDLRTLVQFLDGPGGDVERERS